METCNVHRRPLDDIGEGSARVDIHASKEYEGFKLHARQRSLTMTRGRTRTVGGVSLLRVPMGNRVNPCPGSR